MRMNDMVRYNGTMYRVICIRAELDLAIAASIAVDGTIINRAYILKGEIMSKQELINKRRQEIMEIIAATVVEGRPTGNTVRPLVSKQKMHALKQELLALESDDEDEAA